MFSYSSNLILLIPPDYCLSTDVVDVLRMGRKDPIVLATLVFLPPKDGKDSVGLITNPAIAPQDNINVGCTGALSRLSIQNISERSAKAIAGPTLG